MHVAFACSGDLAAAREALAKAERAAKAVGEIEDLFSIALFLPIPVSEFLIINQQMRESIEHWELWDGMKLSATGN
jgi:hypothetical protein